MEALRMRQDIVRFIQVRQEESAAFMACGYAKFTGRLGVCLATSGPSGIHLLNGLYDKRSMRVDSAMRRKKRGTLKSGRGGEGGTRQNRQQAIAVQVSGAPPKRVPN